MFEYIKGIIKLIEADYIVIENNGIGFKINTGISTASRLLLNKEAVIYTYLNVREDDMSLFGFSTRDELNVFKMLISISGIGPKGALAILSALSVDELRMAVLSDDHKAICKANGIGTKTAQRLIIELKDKFKLEDVLYTASDSQEFYQSDAADTITETAMALTSLGYTNAEALNAIKRVPDRENMSLDELLKAALKCIM